MNLFSVLKKHNRIETLLCYPVKATINDPFEQTKTKTYLNPLPIQAMVSVISFGGLKWKYYGQLPTGSIYVITEPRYKSILLTAGKIEYKTNTYAVYKDGTGFQYLEKPDYCIFILSLRT